jgi:F-type H+-transporting ATPase subunit b
MASALLAPLLSEGGAATFLGLPYAVWQTVNLVAFFALLVWLLHKPISQFFQNRQREVADTVRKAEAEKSRAEALAEEIAARLSKIEGEIEALRAHAREQADAEEKEIAARAVEEAERVAARSRTELDARVRSARNELTAYAADLAVELARDLVKKNVTPEDEKRLVADGVKELAGGGR